MLKRFVIPLLALVGLALLSPPASAQYGGYGYRSTGTYCGSASYAPSYSYHAAGWWQGRWFPAGYYLFQNGAWHRQGYGVEYGLTYDPYAGQHCQTAPAFVAVPSYPPPATGYAPAGYGQQFSPEQLLALAKLLSAYPTPQGSGVAAPQYPQQVAQQFPNPAAAAPVVPIGGPQAVPSLNAEELAKLRAIIAAVQPAPVAAAPQK